MGSPRKGASAIAVLAAMALAGCASRAAPGPALFAGMPADSEVLVERITGALEARRANLRGLRSLARFTYRAADRSESAKHVLVAERPDRLRFEVISLLGSVFVLTARDGALTAYLPSESTVYRGAASRANFARYTRVDLSVSAAIDLILGTPPLLPAPAGSTAIDAGLLRLSQSDDGHTHVAWFDSDLTLVRYERREADDRVVLRAAFAEYRSVDGIQIATRLSLELPENEEHIDIVLRDPELNPRLPDSMFSLSVPADSHEVELDRAF